MSKGTFVDAEINFFFLVFMNSDECLKRGKNSTANLLWWKKLVSLNEWYFGVWRMGNTLEGTFMKIIVLFLLNIKSFDLLEVFVTISNMFCYIFVLGGVNSGTCANGFGVCCICKFRKLTISLKLFLLFNTKIHYIWVCIYK